MTVRLLGLAAFLTTAIAITFVLNPSAFSAVCLDRQPGDTHRFGDALVANQQYLAIADTQANRVIVYRRNSLRQWNRFRTISLPALPPIANPSTNFGYSVTYKLAMAGDTLVIGTVTSKMRPQGQEQQFYPYQPPKRDGVVYSTQSILEGMAYTGAVYRTKLSSTAPLERIDRPQSKELAGFSVAADGDKIAFAVATYDSQTSGYTTVLVGNQRRTLAASGEIALHGNLLVAGSTINQRQGEISIFDLATSELSSRTIKIPMPVAEIALTEKFIVVAEQLYFNQFPQVNPHLSATPKTLIVNISNLSTTFLDGLGKVSAHGNRLVRSYPSTNDATRIGKIELFDLNATPVKLLSTRSADIQLSFLMKNYLFTITNRGSDVMICGNSSS